MKLTCPSCGAVHSAEAWSNDAQARQCLLVFSEMPSDVSRRAVAYLGLFRPLSGRGLLWPKALRLLFELKTLVMTSHIQWDGKPARPNSATAWGLALERVIEQPPKRLPLKSHGYLTSIAYDLADELDRQREVKHNAAERTGHAAKMRETEETRYVPSPEQVAELRKKLRGIGK